MRRGGRQSTSKREREGGERVEKERRAGMILMLYNRQKLWQLILPL